LSEVGCTGSRSPATFMVPHLPTDKDADVKNAYNEHWRWNVVKERTTNP